AGYRGAPEYLARAMAGLRTRDHNRRSRAGGFGMGAGDAPVAQSAHARTGRAAEHWRAAGRRRNTIVPAGANRSSKRVVLSSRLCRHLGTPLCRATGMAAIWVASRRTGMAATARGAVKIYIAARLSSISAHVLFILVSAT